MSQKPSRESIETQAAGMEQLGRQLLLDAARVRDQKNERLLQLMEQVHFNQCDLRDLIRRAEKTEDAVQELLNFLRDQLVAGVRWGPARCTACSANCRMDADSPGTSPSGT